MRESKVERYLKTQVEKHGGMCEKFVSPGKRNVPDRLITWLWENRPVTYKGTGGPVIEMVETKAPGKKPRKGQDRDHEMRARYGVRVSVLDTLAKVDAWILKRFPTVAKPARTPLKPRTKITQGKPRFVSDVARPEPGSLIMDGDISDLI